MLAINAKIIDEKIISSNIFISREIPKRFELNVECSAKLQTPRKKSDKTILLNMELNIGTPNDELEVDFEADIIFELDQMPDNYNAVAEQNLIPLARASLFGKLDELLVIMGYEKMNLAEKIE